MDAKIIIVEGNIGAGKSTITRQLSNLTGFQSFLEPTYSNDYLVKYYEEPKKWALTMQLWLLRQRFKTLVRALRHVAETGSGVILDRSIYSDVVFADQNLVDGNMDEAGYAYYQAVRQRLLGWLPAPDVLLYLDASAEVCAERIMLRARDCESGVPVAYLEGLGRCYGEFVEQMEGNGKTAVVVEDWNSFGDVESVAERMVEEMKKMEGKGMSVSEAQEVMERVQDDEWVLERLQLAEGMKAHAEDDGNGTETLEVVVDTLLDNEQGVDGEEVAAASAEQKKQGKGDMRRRDSGSEGDRDSMLNTSLTSMSTGSWGVDEDEDAVTDGSEEDEEGAVLGKDGTLLHDLEVVCV